MRAYVAALDARDGERVCELIAPGALDELELPRPRAGCGPRSRRRSATATRAACPSGRALSSRVTSVELDGDTAKVVATVVTRFADRDEPSIEDDIVYLTSNNGDWVIAKPSATLYRAIGAEAPPAVLAPVAPHRQDPLLRSGAADLGDVGAPLGERRRPKRAVASRQQRAAVPAATDGGELQPVGALGVADVEQRLAANRRVREAVDDRAHQRRLCALLALRPEGSLDDPVLVPGRPRVDQPVAVDAGSAELGGAARAPE